MLLLNELRNWRNNQARIEGVEVYRVLSNTVLEALVGAMPANKNEMLAIKGIKEAKFAKYGAVLLQMIAQQGVFPGSHLTYKAGGPVGKAKETAKGSKKNTAAGSLQRSKNDSASFSKKSLFDNNQEGQYFRDTSMCYIVATTYCLFMFMVGFFFWEKRGRFVFAVARG